MFILYFFALISNLRSKLEFCLHVFLSPFEFLKVILLFSRAIKIAGKIIFKDKIAQPLTFILVIFLNKGFPKKILGMSNNCQVAILAQFTIGP